MKSSLDQLIEISNFYGKDPEYVLAGGGNSSYKTKTDLYIKGSGTTMATIAKGGFVKMKRSQLDAIWNRTYPKDIKKREALALQDLMDARYKTELSKRPSVETMLHHLIDRQFSVHTHPPMINGLTCSNNCAATAQKIFGDKILWIRYVDPGYTLAALVRKELANYKSIHGQQPDIIFLENHGIFVSGDSVADVRRGYKKIFSTLQKKIKRTPDFSPVKHDRVRAAQIAPALRMLAAEDKDKPLILVFKTNKEFMKLTKNKAAFKPVSSAYTPDHMVYYKEKPLFVNHRNSIDDQYREIESGLTTYRKINGYYPKIVAIQNLGVFALSDSKKTVDIAMKLFTDAVKVSVYVQSFGGTQFMTKAQIKFIDEWEVENYRKKVTGSYTAKSVVAEKIVVITGSAQGFGAGIAEQLIAHGANVVIADINLRLAQEKSDELCAQFGKGKAMAVAVDVRNEESIQNMLIDTVLEYGGIDVLISNAGVLKAGGLDTMTKNDFDFVTGINYAAYFLVVKYTSPYMKIQNRFNSEYYMDIIQINSKSGLEGSKKNFAYAGGKFGGLGLTQSFALELIENNIKVNSVCPGNFFDGPLWANPTNGLFIQYLRAKKVPGARTINDVKKFYEEKVPMKRGCSVEDVVKAINYIIDQKYETGQAVPVTGGQNMLN